MKTSFDYFAPPGETEVPTYGAGFQVKSAFAEVALPLIVDGVECQPRKFIPAAEGKPAHYEKQRTPIPSLPQGTVRVKNPGKMEAYLRIVMDLQEVTPPPDAAETDFDPLPSE